MVCFVIGRFAWWRGHEKEYRWRAAAIAAVARQEGVGRESLRRWVVQAEIDNGARDGVTSSEAAEIKALKAENRRLREDVAIRALRRRSMWRVLDPRNR